MSDRGIKKWAPYKTLDAQDFTLKKQKESEEKIEKPKISADFAEEINEILVNYHGEELTIKYYKNGKVIEVVDRIKRIDAFERKLYLFSKKTILINDIVSIVVNDAEEFLWEELSIDSSGYSYY